MKEGESIALSAKAGGARKVYWVLQDGDKEQILAVDRFSYTFNAGRLAEAKTVALQFKAVFRDRCEKSNHPDCHSREYPESDLHTPRSENLEWPR